MTEDRIRTQVLVLGAGLAGGTAALTLAEAGFEVLLISAGPDLLDGNSALAQGGIVYSGDNDDPKLLEKDILTAGWEHNYLRAVRFLTLKGPETVRKLLIDKLEVPFESEDHSFRLTREGGHSLPRVLYCADYTGRIIMDRLTEEIAKQPGIRQLTDCTAIDLLTSHHHSREMDFRYNTSNQCVGAYLLNNQTNNVVTVTADYTVLATGGVGQIYLHTTNSPASTGSGLAMAHRAGAKIMNAEYIQFHPTALFHRSSRKFLISEAVRGEGARLVNSRGEAFMKKYDSRGDLAPRDIVTRAIIEEMLHNGDDFVFLDAANHVPQDLKHRFPTIYKNCLENGIDICKQAIPVVPAAHYFCGGVLVDLAGKTTIDRLYAAGECACTGIHGANRLASTSLLEALLWGHNLALDIVNRYHSEPKVSKRLRESIPDWEFLGQEHNDDPALIAQDWTTIKNTMWNYVGISRNTPRLKRAFEDMRNLNKRQHDFYRSTPVSKPLINLFHGCQAAYIITTAALRNQRSKGCHFRSK
ncbi:MAG: L-aspartate oxidase [Desulfonatronovibrionaceae bacterium]